MVERFDDGSQYGINVGLRSLRTGAPIRREAEALADLEGPGQLPMYSVAYDSLFMSQFTLPSFHADPVELVGLVSEWSAGLGLTIVGEWFGRTLDVVPIEELSPADSRWGKVSARIRIDRAPTDPFEKLRSTYH